MWALASFSLPGTSVLTFTRASRRIAEIISLTAMSLTTWQQEEELDPEQEIANFTHERRLAQQAQQLQQAGQRPLQRLQQPVDDQVDDEIAGDFFSNLPGGDAADDQV